MDCHRMGLVTTTAACAAITYSLFAGGLSASAQTIQNPGFEGPYSPAPVQAGNAFITGVVADNWSDLSSSARCSVNYSEEMDNVHGGSACQKIQVTSLDDGTVIFGQTVNELVKGHGYVITIWSRSDGRSRMTLLLSEGGNAADPIGEVETSPLSSWQKITLDVTAQAEGPAFIALEIKAPAVIWVDDVSLADISPKK